MEPRREQVDPTITRLWRAYKTIKELCGDRGYAITDEEKTIGLHDFADQFFPDGIIERTKLNFVATFEENEGETIYVYFAEESSVSIKTVRRLISILDEKKIPKAIMIWSESMTASARKLITGVASSYSVEDFQEADLLVNITQHSLVPRHEVMTSDAKSELLKKYRLRETQLPRILINDPVAKYYGLKRGQVVKITRPSETAGRYVSYRICVG